MKTKQVKREEADARNAEWRKLSANEQIEILWKRPGKCKKQLAKIGGISHGIRNGTHMGCTSGDANNCHSHGNLHL